MMVLYMVCFAIQLVFLLPSDLFSPLHSPHLGVREGKATTPGLTQVIEIHLAVVPEVYNKNKKF